MSPEQEYSSDSPALAGRAAAALAGALPLDPAAPGGAGEAVAGGGVATAATEDALTARVALRATAAEVAGWRARAAAEGLGLSDWMRVRLAEPGAAVAVTGRPSPTRALRRPPAGPAVDPAAVAAVVRVGTNLNQLARWANTERSQPALLALQQAAAEVRATLAALRAAAGQPLDQADGGGGDAR